MATGKRMQIRTVRTITIAVLLMLSVGSALLLTFGGEDLLLRRLLRLTDAPFAPKAFGVYHLSCLALCILIAVVVGIVAWKIPEHSLNTVTDRVVFLAGVLFFLLEWYKQLYVFFVTGNGYYDFSVFPFQFCSLPIYVCLTAPLLKEGRLKKALLYFLAFYGTVGGYLVMGYPNLPQRLSLCLHTMLWHGMMILLGVFLLCSRRTEGSLRREYLPPAGIFVCSFALATVFNLVLYPFTERSAGNLNLFYMSPHYSTYFWVISDVQARFGWGASVLCYLLMFLLIGALPLWGVSALLGKLRIISRSRKEK